MAPAASGTDAAGADGELTGEGEAGTVATLPEVLPTEGAGGSVGGVTPQPTVINKVAAAARPGTSFIFDS
jgi:hypothetical protein